MSYHEFLPLWKKLLEQGLHDDGMPWDWTARALGKRGEIHARVIAKSAGVWAAETLVGSLSEFGVTARSEIHDGEKVTPGVTVCEWSGDARTVLSLERPFLNLASYVSGVATQTQKMVASIAARKLTHVPRLTLTRKTLPGYRDVAILGVIAGGGFPHRVSLAGGVLIKENHIAAAGGISQAVAAARSVAPHLLKIEIEVRNLAELAQALQAGAEVVLLDNFKPAEIVSALQLIPDGVVVEASGGITPDNISTYAIEGLDVISVGSITHSVQALDLSLLVQ